MKTQQVASWILVAGGLALFAACTGEPKPTERITARGPGDVVLLIEREGGAGPYVESTAERFKVVASGESLKSVRWSANAGQLEADAEHVTWTLPTAGTASLSVSVETESGKTAEGSFQFSVMAAPLATSTVIDTGPDDTGGYCELAFDSTGTGHIVYTNDTRKSLWYASWNGTTWTREQIDGAGFNNDGVFISEAVLAVDPATGTPHVGYIKGTGIMPGAPLSVGYASRVNGVWVRESIPSSGEAWLGITLNPTQGQQPVIVFSRSTEGTIRVASRAQAGTWSTVPLALPTDTLRGDPVFDSTGALHFISKQGTNTNPAYFLQVLRGTALESFRVRSTVPTTPWLAMVWGPDRHLFALSTSIQDGQRTAIDDITVGTPASSSTLRSSPVDYQYSEADLAYDGSKPIVAMSRGTSLELSTPDARGFWTYTQLGTVDIESRPSVAIRPTTGTAHVCYRQDGKVSFQ